MIYTQSPLAIGLFITFVLFVLGLSFFLARRTSSAAGYYAAGGQIHWLTNGIAFAGDYLSAASFLGICGMIATAGYDGWMYSIGYLAGWIVALFLVAEPMKRLGKYTFTDALDSKFNSKAIQLMAAISTLLVSVFYLIPQMVGAGGTRPTPARLASLGRCLHRRRCRNHHCCHCGHGFNNLRPVFQGSLAPYHVYGCRYRGPGQRLVYHT